MNLRDFVWAIYLANGETVSGVISALKILAAGQYKEVQQGGKTLISSSINGQQFTFDVKRRVDVLTLARQAFIEIKDMTDADLVAWLMQTNGNFTIADFSGVHA